jgi:hypothetical protein
MRYQGTAGIATREHGPTRDGGDCPCFLPVAFLCRLACTCEAALLFAPVHPSVAFLCVVRGAVCVVGQVSAAVAICGAGGGSGPKITATQLNSCFVFFTRLYTAQHALLPNDVYQTAHGDYCTCWAAKASELRCHSWAAS